MRYLNDGPVIVAVEGPSAAGKTTWCGQQPWPVVDEYAPTGRGPDGADRDRQAAYWVQVDSGRWQQALQLEKQSRVVLCDSDPLKLHYSWCLARIGAAPWSRFQHELCYVRETLATDRLGFTDMVLVSIPPLHVLRSQKPQIRLANDDRLTCMRNWQSHCASGTPQSSLPNRAGSCGPGLQLASRSPRASGANAAIQRCLTASSSTSPSVAPRDPSVPIGGPATRQDLIDLVSLEPRQAELVALGIEEFSRRCHV
jgi:hypothetical protein